MVQQEPAFQGLGKCDAAVLLMVLLRSNSNGESLCIYGTWLLVAMHYPVFLDRVDVGACLSLASQSLVRHARLLPDLR